MKVFIKICQFLIAISILINIFTGKVFAAGDELFDGADKFLNAGKTISKEYFKEENVKNASENIYNIFFVIGLIAAVIIGVILGIQFIVSGIDGKAKVKESLIAYVIGCIVVFGSFGIWKLTINIFATGDDTIEESYIMERHISIGNMPKGNTFEDNIISF